MKDGGSLKGKLVGRQGDLQVYDVKLDGASLSFAFDFGGEQVRIDMKAKLGDDGKLSGRWESEDGNSGEWSSAKSAPPKRTRL